jgi:hypothetical protein
MKVRPTLTLLVSLIALIAVSCSEQPATDHQNAPTSEIEANALSVVKRKTDAYNAHNLSDFLSVYHPDVRIYEYPDMLLGEGRGHLENIFKAQFDEEEGQIVVHSRHALENIVLSDESSTTWDHTEHLIGIYTVKDGLIVEVRLIEPTR